MGWRVSWYCVPKEKWENLRYKTSEEIDEVNSFSMCSFVRLIHDSATYVWAELRELEEFRFHCTKFFTNKMLMDDDVDLYVLDKEGLRQIIQACGLRVMEYLSSLTTEQKDTYIKQKVREWTPIKNSDHHFCIDLSEDTNLVSGSRHYEYGIFDLIHMYKNFDWEHNVLVVYGG